MRPAVILLVVLAVLGGGIYFEHRTIDTPAEFHPLLNAINSCSNSSPVKVSTSDRINCELEVCKTLAPMCDRYASWEVSHQGAMQQRTDNAREDARPY